MRGPSTLPLERRPMSDSVSAAPVASAQRPPAPLVVRVAIRLLWIHVALGLLGFALFQLTISTPNSSVFSLSGQLLGLAVAIAFTVLLAKGFGWVRYIWTALVLVSLFWTVRGFRLWFEGVSLMGATGFLGTLTLWAALVLLFMPESREWFRRTRYVLKGGH